tara:strand:+ start:867 stop:1631 length:765 start_codon:yes stop_codon:yes gene_type:complete
MNLLREYIRALLDKEHADGDPWEEIFQQIRAHKIHGKPMPSIDIDSLASAMNSDMGYDVDRAAFTPTKYSDFDEWFLRKLTPETLEMCLIKASLSDICSPVQGTVRKKVPAGEMTLKKSVIAAETLLDIMQGDDLLQISLQKTDYHRVHSPVDGKFTRAVSVEKDELFPGSEAMVIIEIESTVGPVKVMCIGEWTVQSFITTAEVGTDLMKMDELGHFYFGSQVIVVIPTGVAVIANREGKQRVFPGDPMGVVL